MRTISTKALLYVLLLWIIGTLIAGCNVTPQPTVEQTNTPTEEPQEVVLTMGAWRTATEPMNRVLNQFNQMQPHLTVRWEPTLSGEYDTVLQGQLETGTASDLFFLRSFSTSQKLFEQGYVEPLENMPGLRENFTPSMLAPWATEDNELYGVPFTATSHGIYYNMDIFQELGLTVPQTWEELLTTAQVIKEAGYTPFANGSKDTWTTPEIVFMNLAPNFVGGREGRMEYLAGERCFDDNQMVATFQAVEDLAPYFPAEHKLLGYVDSLQLFLQGQAPMWLSGSWDIPYFEEAEADFAWSIFAVPPPSGQPAYITFHLDVGIGLNAASKHKEEAKEFLMWMTNPEFGKLLGNEMPGFFPMHQATESRHSEPVG